MKKRNALTLLKEFCIADFRERDIKKALSFLSHTISWFGTSDGEEVRGIDEAEAYITREIGLMNDPYGLEFSAEFLIDTGENTSSAFLRVEITGAGVTLPMRMTAGAALENGEMKLFSIHMSVSDTLQQKGEYFPITVAKEKIAELKAELESATKQNNELMDSIMKNLPCGVVICDVNLKKLSIRPKYISDSFFDLFGVSREEAIVSLAADPFGCMHPDDLNVCYQKLMQIAGSCSDGSIRYRCTTGGGTQRWMEMNIHCVRKDKESITTYTTYYDISEQLAIQSELDKVIQAMSGGFASYRYKDGKLSVIYISDGAAALGGCTAEEYKRRSDEYGILINVFEGDREYVEKEMRYVLKTKEHTDITFRIPLKNGENVWINAAISFQSEDNEGLIISVVFTGLGKQAILFQELLDESATAIFVRDKNSYELLYANKRAFEIHSKQPDNYFGRTCYSCMFGFDEPCSFCPQKLFTDNELKHCELKVDHLTKIFDVRGRLINFNGHEAYIQYLMDVTEKQNILHRLEENSAMLNIALKASKMIYWIYDFRSDCADFGETAQNALRLPDPHLEKASEMFAGSDYLPKKYSKKFLSMMSGMLINGRSNSSIEIEMNDSETGKTAWKKITCFSISSENGKPVRIIGIATDITEQKEKELKYERELQVRDGLLKEAAAYYQLNLNTRIIESRKTFISNYIDMPDKFTDDFWEDTLQKAISPEYRDELREQFSVKGMIDAYYSGNTALQSSCFHLNPEISNKWYRVDVSIIRRPQTKELIALLYVKDVDTDYKKQLALASIIDDEIEVVVVVNLESGTAVCIKTPDNEFTSAKPEEIPYTEFMENMLCKNITPEDKASCCEFFERDNLIHRLSEQSKSSVTYRCDNSDGITHRKKISVSYLDESCEDIVIARRDVTDLFLEEQRRQAKLREALQEAERANNAKSEFLSNMSHDMRTPMNGILGLTYLMEDQNDIEAIKKELPQLRQSGKYLLQLINDVLDVNKVESGNIELHPIICDEKATFDSIIDMVIPMTKQKNIEFNFHTKNIHWGYMMLDEQRVKQIFMNLLGNAVKFTPDGGKIDFYMELVSRSEHIARDRFIIRDNGIGISKDFLPRMFEPFAQENRIPVKNQNGTGLGLTIVKRLIELMGGTISVKSSLGKGTEFTVYLDFPVAALDAAPPEPKKYSGSSELPEGLKILLCEDHPLNAQIAVRLLEKKGAKVTWAKNGRDGLDEFLISPAGSFDAILMDIRMPVMDGLEASAAIRDCAHSEAKTIPIIAMTANAFDEDIQKSFDAGMNAHLAKPIEPDELYRTLAQVVSDRIN